MTKLFDISLVFTQLPKLTSYLYVNLEIAAIALVIGWAAGLVIALIPVSYTHLDVYKRQLQHETQCSD